MIRSPSRLFAQGREREVFVSAAFSNPRTLMKRSLAAAFFRGFLSVDGLYPPAAEKSAAGERIYPRNFKFPAPKYR